MARWDTEIENHPAQGILEQLGNALTAAPVPETPESIEELDHVKRIYEAVSSSLADADGSMIPDRGGVLNTIQNHAQNATTQVTSYTSSGNPQHLTNAASSAEAMLGSVVSLRVASLRPGESVAEDATRYRQQIGQLIRNLRDEVDGALESVSDLETNVGTTDSELNALASELKSKLNEWEAAFQNSQSDRQSAFDALRESERELSTTSLEAALQSLTEKYGVFQEGLEDAEAKRNSRSEKFEASWSERLDKFDPTVNEIISKLEGHLENAEGLAGKIAETGLSGRYLTASTEEAKAARWWFGLGFFLALALVGGAAWFLFIYRPGDLSVGESIRRAVWVLVASALPLLAFREGADHRLKAQSYKRLHIELASLPLYLADLDESEIRKQKIERVADYFPGRSISDDPRGDPKPYRSGLLGLGRRKEAAAEQEEGE